ncbi:DUF6603 domain-containing protein [Haloarchaeobius sp. HME9146]|uniref:DUF6603 domain-containing protein n=1 Tax=Haloarchaeobius sp. HME9146 TaxID=2978732 RepID=UPI0021BECF30|nr:DUF6603 domain-containing protein [Haloarchaeobius sp. HME9146]MCT9098241.1 hypothetical protein [Haloarchaeobius sp. HME9146]
MSQKSTQPSGGGTESVLARELTRVVEPVIEATESPDGVVDLLDGAGIGELLVDEEVEKVVEEFERDFVEPAETIIKIVENGFGADDLAKVGDLVGAVSTLIESIKSLDELEFESPDVSELGDALLDHLVVRYLYLYRPHVHDFLAIVGVVTEGYGRGQEEIQLTGIAEAVQDPNTAAKETLGWGTDALRDELFLRFVGHLATEQGLTSIVDEADVNQLDTLSYEKTTPPTFPKSDAPTQLDTTLLELVGDGFSSRAGVKLTPMPFKEDDPLGLLLQAYATGGFKQSLSLGKDWTLTTGIETNQSVGFAVRPTGDGTEFQLVSGAGLTGDYHADAALSYEPESTSDSPGKVLLGEPDGSFLALGSVSISTALDYDGDSGTVAVELPASGSVQVRPKGGFLEKVLPDEVGSDFDVTVGWSTLKGLYFEGGATLEVALPVHQKLGPLDIKEIFLSLGFDAETGEITVQAAASASVKLGPIVGTVTRIGLETDLSFPENKDGNMGVVDLELGFKPPEGVGLDIAAGPVTGGGYLDFDPENERYAGTGQLTVPSGLSISVVGLITTELPDGSDGFSMMLIVAGEFDAVQLGFGFTLNGVGGMLGINRKFRKKPLQDVVRQGELDSVLFPEDVVENAQRIISDVRAIFPPTRGTHVFGPMLKIGWGTPAIIEASVGVVLEIPSFRIAILGKIEMALPNLEIERPEGLPEEVPYPPIQINLDVVGIIDIPGKTLSLDASLYDSRIMQWKMSGDMALRSSWGDDSKFLLSIGGFNPRYEQPGGFPKLDRVKVSLDVPGGQPVIDFTGYLAVSSNTFQVGAQVNAELEVGPLSIWGGLGFDALFRFNPFSFIIDFFAHFGVAFKGWELTVGIDGTMSGPTPFNLRGKAKFSVGPFDVSKQFDVTLGKDAKTKQLPTAEVLPELVDALSEPKNWDAQLPGDGNAIATLRSAKSAEAREQARQSAQGGSGAGDVEPEQPIIAHPLGTLTVRQTVVPLNYHIEKFGEARPTTYDEFRIAGVTLGGVRDRDRQPVDEEFAPAAFRKMDDAKKLESDDFVDLEAGTTAGDIGLVVGGEGGREDVTEAAFTYEEVVYDDASGHRGENLAEVDAGQAGTAHTAFTAHELSKGKRGVQPTSEGLFGVDDADASDGGLFGVGENDYVVVDVDTFEPVVTDFVGFDDGGDDGDGQSDESETREFAAVADSSEAERVRPGLHVGTSKGRAQVELKRFAREADVDEKRLQVVSAASLEGSR